MPGEVIPTAPAEPDAIPLYPDSTEGSAATENWAGTPDHRNVRNVTRPTLTPILPDPAKATGAAVLVAPGGGFMALSMDAEGWAVGRWLADHGIAAFVLKYRVIPTPVNQAEASSYMGRRLRDALRDPTAEPQLREPRATQDALAALRLVRARSAEWKIDPARLGMIGFSAGAMTAMSVVLEGTPADRPAYFGYIYGPQTAVTVPADAPPMFAAIAWNDQLFPSSGFAVEEAWKKAKRPVELHVYQKGGHGFGGLGQARTTTTLMMEEFRLWLEMNGWLKG